jgi:soluble cytochrome b562
VRSLATRPGGTNTANGTQALDSNTTGDNNTASGFAALEANTTGSNNTALGIVAGGAVTTANNVIAIGAGVQGENVSNTCYIGNIFGATSAGAAAVYVNSLGKLGTVVSSQRFKEDVKPMDKASEAILALKPVTFRYKEEIDPARSPQFGLVAEDVEKVNPALVVRDREGKVNTVRYEAVNAMLLNEFLKEHRKVEEQQATISELKSTASRQEASIATQEATIADLKKGMEVLIVQLKEQAAQIQKVSAQIEMSKVEPQMVANDR